MDKSLVPAIIVEFNPIQDYADSIDASKEMMTGYDMPSDDYNPSVEYRDYLHWHATKLVNYLHQAYQITI